MIGSSESNGQTNATSRAEEDRINRLMPLSGTIDRLLKGRIRSILELVCIVPGFGVDTTYETAVACDGKANQGLTAVFFGGRQVGVRPPPRGYRQHRDRERREDNVNGRLRKKAAKNGL